MKDVKTAMGVFFVLDFWKGKRKEKESSTDDSRPYLHPEVAGACLQLSRDHTQDAESHVAALDVDCAALARVVQIPPGIDRNEWLAMHTLSFFNLTNQLCAVCAEMCTSDTCPTMSVPGNSSSLMWVDERGKKSKHNAAVYTSMVMSCAESLLQDETVFPTKYGNSFPTTFESTIRRINRLLLHIIFHLYHAHFRSLLEQKLHRPLNSLLAHMVMFVTAHSIVDDKELDPMSDLLQLWGLPPRGHSPPARTPTTPLPIPSRSNGTSLMSSSPSPSGHGQFFLDQRRSPRERSSSPILVHNPTPTGSTLLAS